MLSYNQSPFSTTYTDTTAASLFHLTPQSQLQQQQLQQQQQLTTPLQLPLLLQDDTSAGLDFSNPSIQEYLINNDVLESLAQEVALIDSSTSLSSSAQPSTAAAAGSLLQNTTNINNSTAGMPLIAPHTPIPPSSLAVVAAGISNPTGSNLQTITPNNVIPLDDVQTDQFATMQAETTLSLGVMAYLENLEKQIAEMRRFVTAGFAKREFGRGGDVERQRLHSRNFNFQNITEVNEPFQILLTSTGSIPSRFPVNGVELKSLNHEEMDALLDEYDIPFSPALFLHEKQLLYLRFIGANRAIMHRVVD
ncbi:hypothetical protein TWF730_006760 [Orbilia blumenaviensis]|uniref:Uncharacterized protein n=1 Tax=Orbilia blumenaviensis TaxID=1796055 RepID=A0AAV9VFK5_9PEZI